jgi:phosphoenolpyruvate carboxykinase (GTP)
MGATLSSETTAAAVGQVGVVRRDPMAMLPFIGYHGGDYFAHWIEMGKGVDGDASKLPKIFYVNWFRRGDDGRFLWPGFGENSRVLKWVVERLEDAIDVGGLDLTPEDVAAVLRVDKEEWKAEIPQVTEWFSKFGDKLPGVLWAELDALKARLGVE